jgi:hypothetical protein
MKRKSLLTIAALAAAVVVASPAVADPPPSPNPFGGLCECTASPLPPRSGPVVQQQITAGIQDGLAGRSPGFQYWH